MATVTAIVLSYNRPRMLKEALATCGGADELILMDDGSDFDLAALLEDCGVVPHAIVTGERLSPEDRMTVPHVGALINECLRLATCEVATYLCDDDLWTPEWIPTIQDWFERNRRQIFVRGLWYGFKDGEPLHTAKPHPLDPRGVTAGNFAHRIKEFMDRNIWWDENAVTIHDDPFLHRMQAQGVSTRNLPLVRTVAGYRRYHEWNMLKHLAPHGRYKPYVQEQFAAGVLE